MSNRIPSENPESVINRITAQYHPLFDLNDQEKQVVNVDEALELLKADDVYSKVNAMGDDGYAESLFGGIRTRSILRRGKFTVIAGVDEVPSQGILLSLINNNLEVDNPVYWLTTGDGVISSLKYLISDRERESSKLETCFTGMPLIISSEINLDPDWLNQQLSTFEGHEYPILVINDLDVFFDSWRAAAKMQGIDITSGRDLMGYLMSLAEEKECAIVAGVHTRWGTQGYFLSEMREYLAVSHYADCLCSVRAADKVPPFSRKVQFEVHKNLSGERFSLQLDL